MNSLERTICKPLQKIEQDDLLDKIMFEIENEVFDDSENGDEHDFPNEFSEETRGE